MSHFWGDGFLVFDNGYHHEPAHSRVVEYAFDADAGIVEQVWEYWDPMGRFIPLLGDARRLPNGNTLTSWTQAGMLVELTPEGDEVWRIEADVGTMMGRVSYLEELYVQP